ncbi:hypothetical protein [Streptomyces sp. 1222.5]|uniref:hypothetical protein n=1 Tax=Streptomyces sp. 1222.5 TaxID=1881026 RepID=UPI003D728A55
MRVAALVRAFGLQSAAFERGLRPVSHLIDTPDFFSVAVAVGVAVGVVTLRLQRRVWRHAASRADAALSQR